MPRSTRTCESGVGQGGPYAAEHTDVRERRRTGLSQLPLASRAYPAPTRTVYPAALCEA